MKRILFVDDEPLILEALERMLSHQRHDWEMRFAGDGAEALRLLAESPADVVVSDMRMPQMNGAQLLNAVMLRHPRTVRVILSGFSDLEMIMECIGGTHQFLAKPCSSETLRDVVGRALAMDAWMDNDALKTLTSGMSSLPSMPAIYFDILKALESPDTTLEQIGETIARDAGMTAKMLQLVNSAYFGLHHRLSDPVEAVMQLGLDTIKSLVLGIHVFSELKTSAGVEIDAQELWHHSLATATTARRIAKCESHAKQLAEEAFTAGLLHDVGRLVLLANLPGPYAEALQRSRTEHIPLWEAERAVFGACHAEVGGYLLGLWGLPAPLVETAVFHHCPGKCPTRECNALGFVHIANVLEQHALPGQDPALLAQLDRDYLMEIRMWERAQIWRRNPPTENPTRLTECK